MLNVSINGNSAILNITKEDGTKLSYTYNIKDNNTETGISPIPGLNGDNNATQE